MNFFQLRISAFSIDKQLTIIDEAYSEALFVASPDLYREIRKSNGRLSESLEKTLFKYQMRAANRCTPFGLFVGVVLGNVSNRTNVVIKGAYSLVELDIECCKQIAKALLDTKEIKEHIRFFANSSIYSYGDDLRYFEKEFSGEKAEYGITSIEKYEVLNAVLHEAKNGCFLQNIRRIFFENGYNEEDSIEFTDELISSQLLISELEPTISDEHYLAKIIPVLEKNIPPSIFTKSIKEIQSLLKVQENRIEAFERIDEILREQFSNTVPSNSLHVVQHFDAKECIVSEKVFTEIQKSLASLNVFFQLQNKENEDLAIFKKAFYDRYEESEVPLALALDASFGIGFGRKSSIGNHPVLKDIFQEKSKKDIEKPFGSWEQGLLKLYSKSLKFNKKIIDLSEVELDMTSFNRAKFSCSYFALGSILARSCSEMDSGEYQFHLKSIGGSSAVNLMARFTAENDDLTGKLKEITKFEQENHPDAILAEIVHLPEGRVANVLKHCSVRDYEIPIITNSNVAIEQQVGIDDLMISIPKGEKIILRSKRLNKIVVPRLSNAHNYKNNLPVYSFLCALQMQDSCSFLWDWSVFSKEDFLPRVTQGKIILSKMCWNINRQAFADFEQFKTTYEMPNLVQLIEEDNELLLDLSNPVCIQLLKDELKKKDNVRLIEFLLKPENCWVQNEKQERFASEIVIPLFNFEQSAMSNEQASLKSEFPFRGLADLPIFHVGSEWLYLKIYAGENTIEKLLCNELAAFVKSTELFEKFFFVRYNDGESHLRIRFYNANVHLNTKLLKFLNNCIEPYISKGNIHKTQIDSYKPEYQRYENKMDLAELVFFADSKAVLESIKHEESRIYTAIIGIDAYLNDVGLSISEKINFVEKNRNAFLLEFGNEKSLKRNLDTKYRSFSEQISYCFQEDSQLEIKAIFKSRSKEISPILTSFSQQALSSFIHLFVNRLFVSEQRSYEMLCYHFLFKYYRSVKARM